MSALRFKARMDFSLASFLVCMLFLRFISGLTPTNLLTAHSLHAFSRGRVLGSDRRCAIDFVPCLCTFCTLPLHPVFVPFTPCLYALYALPLCPLCPAFAPFMPCICALHAQSLYPAFPSTLCTQGSGFCVPTTTGPGCEVWAQRA